MQILLFDGCLFFTQPQLSLFSLNKVFTDNWDIYSVLLHISTNIQGIVNFRVIVWQLGDWCYCSICHAMILMGKCLQSLIALVTVFRKVIILVVVLLKLYFNPWNKDFEDAEKTSRNRSYQLSRLTICKITSVMHINMSYLSSHVLRLHYRLLRFSIVFWDRHISIFIRKTRRMKYLKDKENCLYSKSIWKEKR